MEEENNLFDTIEEVILEKGTLEKVLVLLLEKNVTEFYLL